MASIVDTTTRLHLIEIICWLGKRITFSDHKLRHQRDDDLLDHLARIAETSPHLLEDLGITLLNADKSSGLYVWEKGDLTIARQEGSAQGRPRIIVERK